METLLFWVFFPRQGWVLTVPMRNGNMQRETVSRSLTGFLPYLWGMETSHLWSTNRNQHEFLPYLWGMETLRWLDLLWFVYRSYRTYEEWKLAFMLIPPLSFWVLTVPMRNGNYDGIVRYAPYSIVLTVPMRNGNSPHTRQERKYDKVLTVPMRNGNITITGLFFEYVSVLTVPMRNGNPVLLTSFLPCLLSFLPYLWGMETCCF